MNFRFYCFKLTFLLVSFYSYSQDNGIRSCLDDFNSLRHSLGLDSVMLSEKLTSDCQKHADYLLANKDHSKTGGLLAHEEFKDLIGYSLDGDSAGKNSTICFIDPFGAIETFSRTFFHRIPLIFPSVRNVGICYAGDNHYEVTLITLDYNRDEYCTNHQIIYYPAPEANDVKLTMHAEIPDPIPTKEQNKRYGLPITITVLNYLKVSGVKFKLYKNDNIEVGCYLSTPEHPVSKKYQGNTICAIPKLPLDLNTKYTVNVEFKMDKEIIKKKYNFYTIKEF